MTETNRTGPSYSAPALEKGLDIIELLCRSDVPLAQKDIARSLGRTVGELYRMVACLVDRGYLAAVEDKYVVTTRLFELAHLNPPTHRLLSEAVPIMQRLSGLLDQSCHLTVYTQGRQVVVAKVDAPGGMGFSVRVGAELDVLVSTSGRVLLAFLDAETQAARVAESLARRPDHANARMAEVLSLVKARGYESAPSVQVRGLHAVSFPIVDTRGHAIAALTVPYAERIDQVHGKAISDVEHLLSIAADDLNTRLGAASPFQRPGT